MTRPAFAKGRFRQIYAMPNKVISISQNICLRVLRSIHTDKPLQ